MRIKTLLRDEIQDELNQISKEELGTEKSKTMIDGAVKLTDRLIELEKIDAEKEEKAAIREIETDLKLRQMKYEQRDRFIKNTLTATSVIGGMALAVWGTLTSMRFEKEDSFSSLLGRSWINKITSLPSKK